MSKQLALSAAFSTFAMAAFALFAAPLHGLGEGAKLHAGVAAVALEAQGTLAPRLSLR